MLKVDPCSIFSLDVDLVFFKGCRVGRQCFLRDKGVVGSFFVFFLEKHLYPFDLQVGPLLGTQGVGLAPSGKILESTLIEYSSD